MNHLPDSAPANVNARLGCPRRFFWFLGLLIAALVLSQPAAFAQNASGSIGATITDATGAVVPQAKVVLKNEATGALRDSVSNNSGFFNFPAVLPGTYTVTVSAPGLQTWEEQGINMTQGANLTLPRVVLQVQSTKQEVEVIAGADVIVPTDTGTVSQTLNKNMIENLSIVGRDAAELIKIMPGMAMATGLNQSMWNSYVTASNTGPIGAFSAGGTQPNGAMTMTSDGANLLDPGNQGTQTANINQNQVAEVSILTSSYGAEFAKGPITFQAIGKSGGAQFHGQAYLYTRNAVFNAQDSFSKSQGATPISDSFYYPGGDFGGPVLIPGTRFNKNHDKLFFYTAYEYMKQQPAGSLQQYFIPTQEMMQGNFSPTYIASLGKGFANAHANAAVGLGGNAGLSTPGGIIPANLLDPNSAIYQSTYPAANVNPATSVNGTNYDYFLGPPQNRWEYRLRGDYNISDKTKLFVSWNKQDEHDLSPISVWWWIGGQSLPYPSAQAATQKSDVISANLVHTFSPTLTNEFVFAEATFLNPIILGNPSSVNPTTLGFKMTGLFSDPFTPQLPNVFGWNNALAGYFTPTYGESWPIGGANSFGKYSQTPNISDNVTKVLGTHTFKAGVYWDFARNNQTTGGYSGASQGTVEYENWGATSTGNPLADFVIGHATQFTQENGAPVADMKYYQYSFFIQDQWKTSRRLTLTLGLRFDHMGNWFPSSGPGLAVWNPSAYVNTGGGAWDGLEWHAIDPSIPISGFPSRTFFYEPRLGIAYDLFGDGKTVLRGGIGLYRYQLAYNSVSGDALNAPLNIPTLTTTWGCCVGYNNYSQYSPSLGTPGSGASPNGILQMGDDRTPYTWTYNFTISQRLPWRSVAEFQYSGNESRDLMLHGPLIGSQLQLIPQGAYFAADPKTGKIVNPGTPPTTSTPGTAAASGFNGNDYLPLQFYGSSFEVISHGSYSNYNAFIASWQKQSGRVTFTTNYTFSKVLGIRDNESDNGPSAGNTVNPYNLASNYGVLAWDHTQIFNAAYVVNLPSPVHGNAFLGGAVNGWILSGITQIQSGAPIQPNTNGDLNVTWPTDFGAQQLLGGSSAAIVPVLTCDPSKNLKSGQYFNPSCFAPPAPGQNGPSVWPYIHGPAFFNSDLAIYKDFNFKEHHKIEFRFSAFNFLNHPLKQFGNNDVNLNFIGPNNTLSLTNTNALTSGYPLFDSGSVRRVVEFALKYNF